MRRVIFIISIIFVSCNFEGNIRWNENIGIYILDIDKIDLGCYAYDNVDYSEIFLEFKSDSTFNLSKDVPFLFDSTGKWYVGNNNLYKWNYICFQKGNGNRCNQITQCCSKDSFIVLNSSTPKEGENQIPKLIFRKLKKTN